MPHAGPCAKPHTRITRRIVLRCVCGASAVRGTVRTMVAASPSRDSECATEAAIISAIANVEKLNMATTSSTWLLTYMPAPRTQWGAWLGWGALRLGTPLYVDTGQPSAAASNTRVALLRVRVRAARADAGARHRCTWRHMHPAQRAAVGMRTPGQELQCPVAIRTAPCHPRHHACGHIVR